jgi:calcineurin-like phosphoesterase
MPASGRRLPVEAHDIRLHGVLTEVGYTPARKVPEPMRLFFGDVIGKSGRDGLSDHLPGLKRDLKLDFVVVNAENAAGGFGITENTARELFMAGADCLTLGNHSWDQREALTYIVREPRLIRPLNYPRLMDAPGAGANLFETQSGKTVLVMNALGRIHMDAMDDPFGAVEKRTGRLPRWAWPPTPSSSTCTPRRRPRRWPWAISATAAPAWSSAPTPTSRPPTARSCPAAPPIRPTPAAAATTTASSATRRKSPCGASPPACRSGRYTPAHGPATICGVYVETDDRTGLAVRVEPIRVGGRLSQAIPVV